MFHQVSFCPSLTLSVFSPLFLLAAAAAPGLRPLALLPRLCPLLGLGCAAGELPSSSSGPTRHSPWGRSCSAGSTVTVFTSLRWLSMSPVIHRKGVDESAFCSAFERVNMWRSLMLDSLPEQKAAEKLMQLKEKKGL